MRIGRATAAHGFLLPIGLFALTVAARLPFATHTLWAWDSVLYARALEQGFHVDFDLAGQRPQPPGYILYVAAASLLRLILADSNTALVAVSVLASALGTVALYAAARRFCGTGVSLFVAVAYALNPLVWTYGEVAYPYAVLALLSTTLAAAFHLARGGTRGTLVASFAFGLLAGFRQDLLLLLGPLWLWLVWPAALRTRAASAAVALAGVALWLAPSALLSDGLGAYFTALTQQSGSVGALYSVPENGLAALAYNLRFTFYALAWGLLGFAIILAGLVLARMRRALRAIDRRLPSASQAFFLCWVLPATVFYVVVHIGEWGYVLSVLPALYALTGALLERQLAALRGRPAPWRALAAAVAVAPAFVFVFSPLRFSAAELARHDRTVQARVAYVRSTFDTERTIILAREDYLTVRYYLPEYRTWFYDSDPYHRAEKRKRAMRATTIVVFTSGLAPRQNLDVRYVEVASGVTIAYVPIEPGDVVSFYGERFTVQEPR